ncbi:PDDEXK-like protein of unknown function [Pseudarcicella hirudinis]|uniref:Putative exodeoxyribonuclease 8 PDDEXK-like domain-containing protein n=1 Tax=Pseudarcicella hirudinis TaxID=1079859 RepID=A0A1I5SZ79_9BACT|nr:PD-(D/E)XK nuclease-like domain-containing protein [Pseudarcicella hirudinis]SFP76069.1 PDDEXK-like protein of unknown function [Pseudarcicella hirudinis]
MGFSDGILKNVDIEAYHEDTEYISSSAIKEASKSLKHFEWYFKIERDRKSYFDFGNAFELALMDVFNKTSEFDDKVFLFDESKRPEPTKSFGCLANKQWKDDMFDTQQYVINTTGKESFETINFMLESAWQDSTIQKILKETDYQTSIFWTDKATGIKLKTRPDVCRENSRTIVDIKTMSDASPSKFARDSSNFEYPLQAAIQMRGVIESGMYDRVDNYYWVCFEKEPPYNAQIYRFPKAEWAFFQNKLDFILSKIAMAREQNKYIGYTDRADNNLGILELEIPVWYKG